MDIYQIASFMLVATLLVISPGPNSVLIAKTVPLSGKAAGFANISGFIAAFFIHGSLSILGISILLVHSANLFFVIKVLGALYLCWIGIKSLIAAWRDEQKTIIQNPSKPFLNLGKAFTEGFLTNALNPKVSIFYLAAFPQFIPEGSAISSAYTLVLIHAAINLLWFSAVILLISKLSVVSKGKNFRRYLQSFTGFVFIGFGLKLATFKP